MIKLAVIDPGSLDIAGRIVAKLREYGGKETDVGVCRFHSISALHGFCPDVLVVSPEAESAAESVMQQNVTQQNVLQTSCSIALLPGDAGALPQNDGTNSINTGCVVTYGMSPRNTITLSSINESSCVLALQRELLTVTGDVLERQEIRVEGGMKPESLLAVAGALLICGVKLPDIKP
jgi:hypothetical protein